MTHPRLAFLSLFVGLPLMAGSADRVRGPVEAEVLRVVDGDTIAVRAHVWPGHLVEVSVRVAGIDTPEAKGKCQSERELAIKARETVAEALASGRALLRDVTYDKYGGRALARVETEEGRDLADLLIAARLARSYGGKAKQGWCDG